MTTDPRKRAAPSLAGHMEMQDEDDGDHNNINNNNNILLSHHQDDDVQDVDEDVVAVAAAAPTPSITAPLKPEENFNTGIRSGQMGRASRTVSPLRDRMSATLLTPRASV